MWSNQQMDNRKLTKRELKEQRKQEKALEREEYKKSKFNRRLLLWGSIILGLAAAVFIIMKLASAPSTPAPTTDQTLAPVESIDWTTGNASAAATLIEYSDFQCPACKAYEPMVQQINSELKDKVRFVYRYFPLRQIHKNADISSQAAEAAGKQGKFWEMHKMLFDKQSDWENSKIAEETFAGYASELGLNVEQFKKDLISDETKKRIQRDVDSGTAALVDSTPTFFLNGKKLDNPRSYDAFKELIEKTTNP